MGNKAGLSVIFIFILLWAAPSKAANWTKDFIGEVIALKNFEFQESQMALDQSGSDAVKQYAQRMMDDYASLADSLDAAAAKDGYGVETGADPQEATRQKSLGILQNLSGPAFDQQYIRDQIDAHGNDYLGSRPRGAMRGFVVQALPVLQEHQAAAVTLRGP
jgi:putative membrane protein